MPRRRRSSGAGRAREQALVESSKLFEVAEIQKKTEAEQLAIIKIQSDQKVAQAQARQKEIELSGAITETERMKLEVEKETKIGVAKAWAEGLRGLTLPKTLMLGGGEGGKGMNPMEMFFNLKNVETADKIGGTK